MPSAAGLLLVFDVVTLDELNEELDRLFPVLVFLAAVLVLAFLCAREGLFDAAGHWLSRTSGGQWPAASALGLPGSPWRPPPCSASTRRSCC